MDEARFTQFLTHKYTESDRSLIFVSLPQPAGFAVSLIVGKLALSWSFMRVSKEV